jgi:hypothetical protein
MKHNVVFVATEYDSLYPFGFDLARVTKLS